MRMKNLINDWRQRNNIFNVKIRAPVDNVLFFGYYKLFVN